MHIWEVLGEGTKRLIAPKRTKRTVASDFEKNATRLRSKERKLNAQKPIKPVRHAP